VGDKADLLATTGDYLRLWEVQENGEVKQKCLLNNVTQSRACHGSPCACPNQSHAFAPPALAGPLKEQELRVLCPAHLVRLERNQPQHHRDILYRHYLHHLGHRGNASGQRAVFWLPPPRLSSFPLLQRKTAITQLIAHDKEVYDIAFAKGTDLFASVGADGSVRMFDLRCRPSVNASLLDCTTIYCTQLTMHFRNLEHSTIIYESPEQSSLPRLCWNRQV